MPTDVLLADDHPLVLKGLADFLGHAGFRVVAACPDGPSALAEMRRLRPPIAVLDLVLPGLSGLEVARAACAERLPSRIVLLTAVAEEAPLVEAIRLGVAAVVTKDLPETALAEALQAVRGGGRWFPEGLKQAAERAKPDGLRALSAREREIARLAAQGHRNKQIAHRLALREGTVKIHLYHIYSKLQVKSRTELALIAQRERLI